MATKSLLLAAAAASSLANAVSVDWSGLNSTIGGKLQTTTPLESACFTNLNGAKKEIDSAACERVRSFYHANNLRTNNAETWMSLQSHMCLSSPTDQCLLDDAKIPTPMPSSNSTCRQGSVPSYHMAIETPDDVAAAFSFASNNGVELSVKNSGHDFMIRSSGKGTLNLWTHQLQGMEFHDDFVPQGASEGVGMAMTVDIGVPAVEAYHYADEHDAIILGPYAPSVAISGGWVSGGGHSVLSPVWGLGADRVVEFSVVTPDGEHRIVNSQQDPDLFWALRGGGGGTFGVILSATHRVEPKVPIAFASIALPPNITAEESLGWTEIMLEDSLAWGKAGWGGHVGGSFVAHFNPLPEYTKDNGTHAKSDFQRATDYALSLGGTSTIVVKEGFSAIYDEYLLPQDVNMGGGVSLISSRLMPMTQVETKEGRDAVLDYMRAVAEFGADPRGMYTPVTTPYVWDGASDLRETAKKETSMTPAWYGALWHFETSGSFGAFSTYEERLDSVVNMTKATLMTEELMGPNGGSYLNEANIFTPDWQDAYWGKENYAKLLEIKGKYDPERLLKCWKCVGFDEEKDMELERFRCNAKMQGDVLKAVM